MGVIFRARQRTLKRIVALKVILAGRLACDADVKRFRREARAAGRLKHPNIVPIHEVGEHEGHHYFTMDLVEGRSLADLVREETLAPRHAAEIVAKVAEAVEYAHQNGTLHRDLKPANILIDGNGEPHITDFGLAKLVEVDDADDLHELTKSGQVLGTPSYMSPEQACGKSAIIGPASDIYSLGAILYSSIAGRAPFVSESTVDTLMQVIKKEPVPPRDLNPSVPRDIDTICLKCLNKEPHRRYGTAKLLADDLHRFLQGLSVLARPVGPFERGLRWCKRNKLSATLLTAIAVSLAAGSAVSTYYAIEAGRRAEAEADAKAKQVQLTQIAEARRRKAERLAVENEKLARAEQTANETLRTLNSRLTLEKATKMLREGKVSEGLLVLANALEYADTDFSDLVSSNLALWESASHSLENEHTFGRPILSIARTQNDNRVSILLGTDNTGVEEVRFWDLGSDRAVGEPIAVSTLVKDDRNTEILQRIAKVGKLMGGAKIGPIFAVTAATLSPGAETLYLATRAGTVLQYDIANRSLIGNPIKLQLIVDRQTSHTIDLLELSADGKVLLAASRQNRIARLFSADSLDPIGESMTTRGWISCAAFHPSNSTVTLGIGGGEGFTRRGEVHCYSTRTGLPDGNRIEHPGRALALAFDSEGSLLAVGGSDGSVVLWDFDERLPTGVRFVHNAPVNQAVFGPLRGMLLSSDSEGQVQLNDPVSGRALGTLPQRKPITSASFTNSGTQILIGDSDGALQLWRLGQQWPVDLEWQSPGPVASIIANDEGTRINAAWHGTTALAGGLAAWDTVSNDQIGEVQELGAPNSRVTVSADLTHAATWAPLGTKGVDGRNLAINLRNLSTGDSQRIMLPHVAQRPSTTQGTLSSLRTVAFARFSPDSNTLMIVAKPIAGRKGLIWLYDLRTGTFSNQTPMQFADASNPRALHFDLSYPLVGFDSLSQHLFCGDLHSVKVWRVDDGETAFIGPQADGPIRDVALVSSGELIAIAAGSKVSIHPVGASHIGQGTALFEFSHANTVRHIAFAPSGELLATASDDRLVRFWDTDTGVEFGTDLSHVGPITGMEFNHQGSMLAVVCDRVLHLWDVNTGQPIGPPIDHAGSVQLTRFTVDGSRLITVDSLNSLRMWTMTDGSTRSPDEWRSRIRNRAYVGSVEKSSDPAP
ncbi:serine/threonine-protein kinase [Aeoliella sp. ICT_H6.2]|uniref:non-specific serine/threonine protein kinase n=1 Tax=Aeoliella straminimaris TaxID=2954799 RepID=A0A9X2F6V5_9BACT|nr:serine/threonine-protein kinase [Aeoliella straminimaris]MCO6042713.1 serine/threonine-protein kinase [Aeoliella straminimaris]